MQGKITKRAVDSLRPGQSIADIEVKGFIVRRLPSGTVTYGYRFRNREGKQRWLPLGLHGRITPDQARALAQKKAAEVANDRDPVAERETARAIETTSVDSVLDAFIARHAKGLRSGDIIERIFERLVRPRIGSKSIYALQRGEVVQMLDDIEDDSGPVMADRTLAHVRKAFNWWAARDERFTPPIVKGMARTKTRERSRSRILDDDEIRDMWTALDQADVPECYPKFMRTLLLTAQRRTEVSHMPANELDRDDWIIPAARYKTKLDHLVPIAAAVRALVGTPKKGFVFSSDGGKRPFSGYSKAKAALDKEIAALRKKAGRKPMPHWTPHDLRRTARSLMSRAGVSGDIGERVLGHVLPGVRGTYDRYQYRDEKADALQRLAGLIDRILHPDDTVVPFPQRQNASVA